MNNRSAATGSELAYLDAFLAVCTEGGFTSAAAKLGCSQPAVSYQIRRLEAALGVRLLERHGRAIVLTPEGRRVRIFADQVFAELARVRSECLAGRYIEPLRLGSASGFGRYVLMPAIHELRTRQSEHGPAEVRLEYDAADVLLDRLEAGEFEAAFVYKRKVSSALTYDAVFDEQLVLVGNASMRDHLEACAGKLVTELARTPFVTYEECDYVFGRWFEHRFGVSLQVISASHFTELEEVLDFVRHGAGVSVVPRDSAEALLRTGELAILGEASSAPCMNTVYMVTRSGGDVRPRLATLVGLVRGSAMSPA